MLGRCYSPRLWQMLSHEYLNLYLGRCYCLLVVADVNATYIDLLRCVNGRCYCQDVFGVIKPPTNKNVCHQKNKNELKCLCRIYF